MKKYIPRTASPKHKSFRFNSLSLQTLLCSIILVSFSQIILSHGSVTNPPSRVWSCFQEGPEDPDSQPCIDAIAMYGTQALYDWPAILQPFANSNHQQYVLDGNLASGGDPSKYGGMDQVRGDWIATPVSPGPYTVTWTITAQHATLYYDVYITKADWTPDQPLTWDSLELLVRTGELPLSIEDNIDVVLPARTGKHVIYSVWQRSLSQEAFYSTSDVDFGDVLSIHDYQNSFAELKQNFPNPFTTTSTIEYTLNEGSNVTIKVYTLLGEEVKTLCNSFKSAGKHEVVFDLENMSTGIYLYTFETDKFSETRRMILKN